MLTIHCMVHCGSAFEPRASGLPYYCTSICVRSRCNWCASCVDSIPKKIGHGSKKEKKQLGRLDCCNHCFWQALWVHCTEMHTSGTPPTPCLSLTTDESLCTHPAWRPKKKSHKYMVDSGTRTSGMCEHNACSCQLYHFVNRTQWVVSFPNKCRFI